MKLMETHQAKIMKLARRIKSIFFKPQEVHVECLHNDKVFAKLIEFAKKNKNIPYMINTDYEYAKHRSGNFKLSRVQYNKILRTRIFALASIVKEIGLHPHLWVHYEDPLPYIEQAKRIVLNLRFLLNLLIMPTQISFGWWNYNASTETICKCYNLKIRPRCVFIHDYDLVKK